jgi:hypothetical protein
VHLTTPDAKTLRAYALRARGVGLVTNHAVSTTSAPICARLGFRRVFDVAVFRYEAS